MKKTMLTLLLAMTTAMSFATSVANRYSENENTRKQPTYLDDVYYDEGWKANWFVTVQGGFSAFIGSPNGCGDFFDRTKGMMNAAIGKWFKPTVGARLSFQGFSLKDANLNSVTIQNIHADLMYNVSYLLNNAFESYNKWNLIPYVGLGVIHNGSNDKKPMSVNAGVIIGYRFNERLMLSAELGNALTWADFDGMGSSKRLGDDMLQASVGFTCNIGKTGWRRVIDAAPYIIDNDVLQERLAKARQENEELLQKLDSEKEAAEEMKKILAIEGLLDKYNLQDPQETEIKKQPKNNYSGINALRKRMREQGKKNQDSASVADMPAYYNPHDTTKVSMQEYITHIMAGQKYIGAPIFFFFDKGKSKCTDKAQILNFREIANVMKKYNLKAVVIGAADSQTGTAQINTRLGNERSQTIKKALVALGISTEDITTQGRGGIDDYKPVNANRNACVLLYVKQ